MTTRCTRRGSSAPNRRGSKGNAADRERALFWKLLKILVFEPVARGGQKIMMFKQLAELQVDDVDVAANDAAYPGIAGMDQLAGEDGDLDVGAVVAGDGDDVPRAVGSGALQQRPVRAAAGQGPGAQVTTTVQAGVGLVDLDDDDIIAGGAKITHQLQALAAQPADDDVVLAAPQPEGFPLLPEQDAQGLQGRPGRDQGRQDARDLELPGHAAGDVAGVEGVELQGLVSQVEAGVSGRGGLGVLLEAEVAEDAGDGCYTGDDKPGPCPAQGRGRRV